MKLLVVTCLKDSEAIVADIFKKAEVNVFTAASATGFKNDRLGQVAGAVLGSGWHEFDSVFIFTFTDAEKAGHIVSQVKKHTHHAQPSYPIRAFVLPVENTSY